MEREKDKKGGSGKGGTGKDGTGKDGTGEVSTGKAGAGEVSTGKVSTGKVRAKPYERPRGGPAKPVAELVPQIGRAAFRRFGFVQSSVVTRWPEIVGPRHAKVCSPESIRFPPGEKADGILQLVVLPAHAPLIQHVVPEIIERVNRFFGYRAVVRVKLRQGAVQPQGGTGPRAETRTATGSAPPSLKPVPLELGDSLRDVGDPELRAVLESLARSLGHKEDESE